VRGKAPLELTRLGLVLQGTGTITTYNAHHIIHMNALVASK